MIKAVIFDVDGTLVDSNDLHVEAWQEVFRDCGKEVATKSCANRWERAEINDARLLLTGRAR
jgi:beta-phosphoglucomutase-like phosphatase (HAD superfamily)